ncbi:SOS response-associated peptidase [uncultured Gilvimarinus sp.]|uniref:SOS response-associated peptidase n=1 Tax=uncultured Gilvimarinus sp. TaxID=1689143 RepID=UPI0030EB124F
MCGRLFIAPSKDVEAFLSSFGVRNVKLPTVDNISPTQAVPVLFRDEEGTHMGPMRWWLHPHWSPDPPNQRFAMFNARVENVLRSKAYRDPIRYRRAIVPAAAFMEWKSEPEGKQPYYVETNGVFKLAAIWDCWKEELWSCSILTQPASASFSAIHNRMPVSLSDELAHKWMDPRADVKALLTEVKGESQLLRPKKL